MAHYFVRFAGEIKGYKEPVQRILKSSFVECSRKLELPTSCSEPMTVNSSPAIGTLFKPTTWTATDGPASSRVLFALSFMARTCHHIEQLDNQYLVSC